MNCRQGGGTSDLVFDPEVALGVNGAIRPHHSFVTDRHILPPEAPIDSPMIDAWRMKRKITLPKIRPHMGPLWAEAVQWPQQRRVRTGVEVSTKSPGPFFF